MGWIKFSTYRKRIWDFAYKGENIHLVFVDRISSLRAPEIEVVWSTDKFREVKFDFRVRYRVDEGTLCWKEVFSRLRRSLVYGLNPAAQAVTDRLLKIPTNETNPIHNRAKIASVRYE